MPQRTAYIGRDRLHPLKVTVAEDERAEIAERAAKAGLSVASYLRAAALGQATRSTVDRALVGELAKVNGALMELTKIARDQVVLDRIEAVQDQLRGIVGKL